MLTRVVLAVDDMDLRRHLRKLLRETDDVIVESLRGKDHVWERAARKNCDVLLVSESTIPAPIEASLELIHNIPSSPIVVVVSDDEDPTRHAELVAAGCDEVFYARVPPETLDSALTGVLAKRPELVEQSIRFPRSPAQPRLSDFISESPSMQAFMSVVQRVVKSDTSLLILGETGVGKERLARAIHAEGPRSEGPFVAVNCGALPEGLLESELFGHEEGAYTGATRSRRGAFELAHNGVIFLDEVADMPLHLQVKLLRILQEHELQRVGAEKSFRVDLRVMAASNRDMEEEVQRKQFRKDLYYRLSVVTLTVPPLRERQEDIGPLAESYIGYLRPRIDCSVHRIAPEALAAIREYSWPGNVRELINVVERAMLLCDGEEITLKDLPGAISGAHPAAIGFGSPLKVGSTPEDFPGELLRKPLQEVRQAMVENLERVYLTALLRETGGRVGETAKRAGIESRSLYDKMKRYRLRKETFRLPRPAKPQRK
ncbi:MAG: sigma-54-dependent Fis family transcriptional regulator [Phycisphaerae bacterium]|nr:sigma-54-dependent Fis family transcriptional regulator [Phycisphaerae bacterium]